MRRHTLLSIAAALTVALSAATSVEAGSATVIWDPNRETDIAGYMIRWGTQSGVYPSSVDVGNRTTWTIDGLQNGTRYYFVLQAYTVAGVYSDYSVEASAVMTEQGITIDAWKQKFGITDMSADDDGDGVDNTAEYNARTDPTLPNRWYLAEGATGFFRERLALANPGTDPAEATLTFLRDAGTPVSRSVSIPPQGRVSLLVNDIPELANATLSTIIDTTRGGLVAERTMTWSGSDSGFYGGHTAKAAAQPRLEWYFAEGYAGSIDTWFEFANANPTAATLSMVFMLDDGRTLRQRYTAGANSRLTVFSNAVPGLKNKSFSTMVTSTVPVTAERSMYFNSRGKLWKGGSNTPGIPSPATTWYIAEGRTGAYFDQYILIQNPNPTAGSVSIRFLKPDGQPISRNYTLPASSRTTIAVDNIPGLEETDVSAEVTATVPVVVERAMYWPGPYPNWHEGHSSAAVTQTGTRWVLAEGEFGGAQDYESFILFANPYDQDAAIRLTILRAGAETQVYALTVRANSRLTIASSQLALTSGDQFGALVESTNGTPIVVERSLYWNDSGLFWAGGTNETGTRIR